MTLPVTPPAAPVVPLYPPLGSATFNADAYAYGSAMPAVSAALGDLADNVAANAQIAHDNAQTSAAAANNAASAAEVAMGATNFKGEWTSLAGALAKPATVKHNGRFWLLLTDLPNVAASEPTTSNPAWTTLDSGVDITQQVTANTTAIAGVIYIITAPGVTITGPALGALTKGEGWGYVLTAAARTCFLNFASVPYRKRATGAVAWRIDGAVSSKWFQYEDTTQGYI